MAKLNFRPFTESDWDCYAGCESPDPQIAESDAALYIIDGDTLAVHGAGSVLSAPNMDDERHFRIFTPEDGLRLAQIIENGLTKE